MINNILRPSEITNGSLAMSPPIRAIQAVSSATSADRHEASHHFLITVLGIDPVEADQAACKMEHTVPKAIIDRLIKYADYVQHCSRGAITWESGFGYYCQTDCTQQCERAKGIEGEEKPERRNMPAPD